MFIFDYLHVNETLHELHKISAFKIFRKSKVAQFVYAHKNTIIFNYKMQFSSQIIIRIFVIAQL